MRFSPANRLCRTFAPRLLGLFCGLALASAQAFARDLYVDNVAGDNRWLANAPQSGAAARSGPVRTIQRALQLAVSGDRIVLIKNEEPYRESISLVGSRHSGSVIRPFVIEGNGCKLSGTVAPDDQAWETVSPDVYRVRIQRLYYQQLFLAGQPAVRQPQSLGDHPGNVLQPLEWQLADGFLYFRTEPNKLPLDYQPSYAQLTVGVTLYQVQGVVVRDLILQGFHLDGVQAHDAGWQDPVVLAGLTARGNGRAGIALNGAAGVAIDGCLVGNNGHAQVLVDGPGAASVTNSNLLANTAPRFVLNRGGQARVEGQPVTPAELKQEPAGTELPE
ncbi:MAG: right-handed parallel beta-helix repeat-containing protein [Pirellulales bacterium]|nr:right-handed parallel beta-helix repeat-containing protein [Pirellulales bacterium]